MVIGIFGLIGFIVGIVMYGSNGANAGDIYMPIVCAIIGAIIGSILDSISKSIKKSENKKGILAAYLIITTICLGVCFYSYYANWEFVYAHTFYYFANGRIIFGIINLFLFPIVISINYFSEYSECDITLIIGYIFVLVYGLILSFMYGNSNLISRASEHEGKYKVTVNTKTGVEVGERKYLNADVEAAKANAKIVALILLGTLFCPFLAYAFGYYICFKNYFKKKEISKTIIFIIALTILPYIILLIFA